MCTALCQHVLSDGFAEYPSARYFQSDFSLSCFIRYGSALSDLSDGFAECRLMGVLSGTFGLILLLPLYLSFWLPMGYDLSQQD